MQYMKGSYNIENCIYICSSTLIYENFVTKDMREEPKKRHTVPLGLALFLFEYVDRSSTYNSDRSSSENIFDAISYKNKEPIK